MVRRKVIVLTTICLSTVLSSAWTLFYIIQTSKSPPSFELDLEATETLAKREILYRGPKEDFETQIDFSRRGNAELIEEILLCLADSLTHNRSASKQGVVVEFIKRAEDANFVLKELEYAYKAVTEELQKKEDVIEFLSQPIINFHEFEYLHNPKNVCSQGRPVRYLFVVPSAPGNFDRRNTVRESSLYQYISDPSHEMILLFFIGKPPKGREAIETQKRISEELTVFNDIVQEDFEDIYSNIRLKAVAMLRWAQTFCRNAKFVIRTDDDVKISYHKVFSVVERTSRRLKNFILGNRKEGWKPVRLNISKYYVSEKEFPPDALPPFAVGGLLAYPISTVSLLYQAALRIKPIWLDDIFITGMCAPKVGVPLLTHPGVKFEHKAESELI